MKRKPKKKPCRFGMTILHCFNAHVVLSFYGTPPKVVREVLNRFFKDNIPKAAQFTYYFTDNPRSAGVTITHGSYTVVWTQKECPSTLAHECLHAVQRIMASINEDEPGEEVQAYLLSYLVERALEGGR